MRMEDDSEGAKTAPAKKTKITAKMKWEASGDNELMIEESKQPQSNKWKAWVNKGTAKAKTAKAGSIGRALQGSHLPRSSTDDDQDLGEINLIPT